MQETSNSDPVDVSKDVSKSDTENLNDSRWVMSYSSSNNPNFIPKFNLFGKFLS